MLTGQFSLSLSRKVSSFFHSRILRARILKAAVDADHSSAIETAKEMFQKMRKNQTVPANLKQLVFSIGIKSGDEEDWRRML